MIITFTARGHENILASHQNTLEFTKDNHITTRGNCIVGVSAGFNPEELAEFSKKCRSFTMTIECEGITETVSGLTNPSFSHDTELVIRITDFKSERTFGIRADKAAMHLDRTLVSRLKNPGSTIKVTIKCGSSEKAR